MLRQFKDDHEFYASLPKKRIGVGALLFHKGDLLIVQPTYNPGWILPGGTVEAEESPLEALHREVWEETSLKIEPMKLLAVDYIANRDVKGEYLQLLFSAKDLTDDQAQSIHLQEYELKDFCFVQLEVAYKMLTPLVAERVKNALNTLEQDIAAPYLENGHSPVPIIRPSLINKEIHL
jgi:ADP-ribose pyrophosphatase YjhB (NUDIX family)